MMGFLVLSFHVYIGEALQQTKFSNTLLMYPSRLLVDIATIKQKYIYKLYTDASRVGVSFFIYVKNLMHNE